MSEANPNEDDQALPVTEIEGIVRRGEQPSWGGKQNFQGHQFNVIDLSFMSSFFRLMNRESSSRYYIERMVDKVKEQGEEEEQEEEEESGEMYPLPSSRQSFDDSAIKPVASNTRTVFAALFTAAGLFSAFM